MGVRKKPQNGSIPSDTSDYNLKSNLLSVKGNLPEVTFCDISETSSAISSVSDNIKANGKRKRLISNESADSSTSSEKKKPQIPDGGYGWVVVFASLILSLVADGISFSFGLIYIELVNQFQESRTKTAWIGSLFLAVPLLVGPIMSNLVDKYGCRRMTFIGGLLSGLGFALASMCNSIEMLYLTFGIISGLGLGIGYVTAVVSIAFWFDKNRTFATSVGASGTGIGTFVYAPLTNWLIEKYGWRGATLLLGGTLLHICVCGMLMRDPDWVIEENRLESRSQSVTTFSNSSVCLDEIKKLLETGTPKETVLDTLVTNYNTEVNQQIPDPMEHGMEKRYNSEIFLPTYMMNSPGISSLSSKHNDSRRSLPHQASLEKSVSQDNLSKTMPASTPAKKPQTKHLASAETLSSSDKSPVTISLDSNLTLNDGADVNEKSSNQTLRLSRQTCSRVGSRYSLDENMIRKGTSNLVQHVNHTVSLNVLHENEITATFPNSDHPISIAVPDINATAKDHKTHHHNHSAAAKKRHFVDFPLKQSFRRCPPIRNSNYFRDIRVHRNSINYRGAMLNTHRYRLRASSCPNIYRNSMTTLANEEEPRWYDSFVDIMKSMFDFSLFLDAKFFLFNLSTLFLFIWFIIPYFYITEHLLNYHYSEESSALLISIIGIASTVGMVGLGFIGDRPWLNVSKTYGFCLVLCGLSVGLIPILSASYISLVILCIIFGITFGSSFSFTPSILVSIVDLDDFTCAYGLVLLVQGVGSLIGPPLAAFIYDVTLRWDDSFYAAGVFIAISGVLAYLVAVLEDREEERNEK